MVHIRAYEITEGDLLTWEVQLRREGTLPPEVQALLLEHVTRRLSPRMAHIHTERSLRPCPSR
jgi:hypothetical protein